MLDIPSQVSRPGRYIGTEPNAVFKEACDVDIRFALCYPDIYEIGMSYYGYFLLYEIANSVERVWCERCFAPWQDMETYMRKQAIPLFTLESKTPLSEMDLVGFSLSYELNITNVLNMLDLAGIPLEARMREGGPIVIGGGPLVLNPRPFEPFFDLLVVGEAESVLVEILSMLRHLKGLPRQTIIRELATLKGVYSPLLGTGRVRRLFIPDLDASPHPLKPPIPVVGSIHDRLNVEISRGCGNGCRFCIAGYGYRPYRERSVKQLVTIIEEGLARTGFGEISLLSLSSGDYSALGQLISYVRTRFDSVSLSLPSLKIGSVTEEEIKLLGKGARGGFTFALEAAAPELRDRLNKDIQLDLFMSQVPLLRKFGWRNVKLYVMIGFPWEKEADLLSLREILEPCVRQGIDINLSISPFTPKPHTPFQWLSMEREGSLRHKLSVIRGTLPRRGVKVKFRDIQTAMIEALISRGDGRLASLFLDLHERGVKLEAWTEFARPDLYEDWFSRNPGVKEELLGARDVNGLLPWDFVDTGINREFLREELGKAEAGELTDDCYGHCAQCGLFCAQEGRERPSNVGYEAAQESGPKTYTTYTLRYGKYGDGRYLGHLDTMNLLLRALRAGGVRLRMHGKYHPKPRISLSPALPVGVESMCELAEIEAEAHPGAGHVGADIINEHLPRGLKVLQVTEGGLAAASNGCVYLLVSTKSGVSEGVRWRTAGKRVFSLWRGQEVKRLWQTDMFERIIKVEEKRIHGS